MVSDPSLPPRLQWTLSWQTRHLVPLLQAPSSEDVLQGFWRDVRHMDDVLQHVVLEPSSLSVDIGGGLTTPLRWLPGRRLCLDPLADHYLRTGLAPVDRVTYRRASGEALPLDSGSADLAICTNCIDHTRDPWAIAAEIHRILRPGGWFWFSCEDNPPEVERNAGHPHALTVEDIRAFMDGFEVHRAWSEPWRGVYGHLTDGPFLPTREHVFLGRKPGGLHAT